MADTRDRWATAVLGDVNISDGCARTAWKLREHADADGRTTVGLARIAKDTGRTRRTVERHVQQLVTHGYLVRTPGQGATTRGGTTTLTRFQIPTNPPTPVSLLNPPTAGDDPPTAVTESTDSCDRKYRQSSVVQTIEPYEPARARDSGARAAPVSSKQRRPRWPASNTELETFADRAARLRLTQRDGESLERFRRRVADADTSARYPNIAAAPDR